MEINTEVGGGRGGGGERERGGEGRGRVGRGRKGIGETCTYFQMTYNLGVSKAILNHVIFCHQEESNWLEIIILEIIVILIPNNTCAIPYLFMYN